MITTNHTKEDLSRAYLMAVAGRAGCLVQIDEESHDYGIDATVDSVRPSGKQRKKACCPIHIQLKATEKWKKVGSNVEYSLDVGTYNYLVSLRRQKSANPVILVVLCLHKTETQWMSVDSSALSLRECCYYWFPPYNKSKKSRRSKEKIQIPAQQLFNPDVLKDFLKKRKEGKKLP